MNYDEWYTKVQTLYQRQLSPRTREGYTQVHARHISPIIGQIELTAITPDDIQAVLISASSSGERTAQVVYCLLRSVLRRAVRSRHITWSPVEGVDKPKHDQQAGTALTQADYDQALPWITDDLALSLALLAGLRRGEIYGLQWGDIDLQHGLIHVRRTRQRVDGQIITCPPKSASGVRSVPIAGSLMPIIKSRYRLNAQALCLSEAPEAASKRWARLQRDTLALSAHYRLHDLRHTYITRLLLAGCKPRVIQYIAGHASLSTTMRVYAHVTAEDALSEIRRVEAKPTYTERSKQAPDS